ncbi:MAG TPA: ImmA/IrrE family metallo-endopeptidase [Candidatus Acidoferrales bacterium]|nr:ImmA/IrrE family metallo-endopeptidase [Candidatus Acidoferrales bacterium]
MVEIKVIKNEKDYREALNAVEVLMATDPAPESVEGEQLELLSTLVADYESKAFPSTLPDPVEAIKFRMEQADLKPADLVPFIGSKSRVSEILSGKRKLTVEMMRSLEAGLGIPAKVLLGQPHEDEDSQYRNWDIRVLKEMKSRGYFGKASLTVQNAAELVRQFFTPICSPAELLGMLRQSSYRSSPRTDHRALAAWSGAVLRKAEKVRLSTKYTAGTVSLNFMQDLAKLSTRENGPRLAQEALKKHGLVLIIEKHFSKTYLDGATILINRDHPVIGLTLRYDRVDNFWFTLMHELAHIALHFDRNVSLFYDEIEDVKGVTISEYEHEADLMAEEALLPQGKWEISPARLVPSFMAAKSLASEVGVHIAIIAGQMRHRGNAYVYLNKIVNEAKVRQYFPEEKWNN